MWQKIWSVHKRDKHIVNKYMKKYITLLVITEMKMKTTIKYYYRPTRNAKIKTMMAPNIGETVKQLKL